MINQSAYETLQNELKENDVTLVAVSKFQSLEKISKLYDWGHRDFGENYVQELLEKHKNSPQDINWHFIGHLQTNKVKAIAPFIHLIQSVDSYKLLSEINKQALNNYRVIDVLIQVYVGNEETKYGLDEKEVLDLLTILDSQKEDFKNIRIRGFMGMATNTEDVSVIEHDFIEMDALFSNMKQQFFFNREYFDTLCIGMSHDYKTAVKSGSNMVRIGSSIFGNRM